MRAWELRDGTYTEVAVVEGDDRFSATSPSLVAFTPDELVR